MLHIILGILKVIGIILLWIVAIVLILLLLALFYPIGYKIKGNKSQDSYSIKGTIHWLLYIITVSFSLEDGKKGMSLRVFGIPINLTGKKKEKKNKKKKSRQDQQNPPKDEDDKDKIAINKSVKDEKSLDKSSFDQKENLIDPSKEDSEQENLVVEKKETEDQKTLMNSKLDEDHKININAHNKEEETSEGEEETHQDEEKPHQDEEKTNQGEEETHQDEEKTHESEEKTSESESSLDDEKHRSKVGEYYQKIKSFVIKIKKIFINLRLTMKRIYDKMKEIKNQGMNLKEFLQSDRFKQAFALCKKELMVLLRHIRPRKYSGYVNFGFEDPASTGQALGAISLFYPIFKDNMKVVPDFEQQVLTGNIYARGHMQTFVILKVLWTLYKDKNIKYMIKKFRK